MTTRPRPNPTLSVLMCNYNHGALLPRAIEAIATQSRPPDEFILLDDGSTDNSVEIIEGYARQYPFIRVLCNERNRGLMASIPIAQAAATGDYLYWGAADDYVLPGFFEQAMDLASRYPEAGVVFGEMVVLGPTEEELYTDGIEAWQEPLFAPPEVFWRDYASANMAGSLTPAAILRTQALNEVGGIRTELGLFADSFPFRVLGLKYGVAYVPQRFAAYHVGAYSSGQFGDPRVMVQVLDRTEALMRSPELAALFPEEYIARWRHSLEQVVFTAYVVERRRPLGRSFVGLWAGRFLHAAMRLRLRLVYHGNVGEYLRSVALEGPPD